MGALRRLYEIAVWQGPAGLAVRALAFLGCRVLYCYVLPSLRDAQEVETKAPIAVDEIGEAGAPEYLAFRRGATLAQLQSRFARGCRCYVARANGAIVSATWVATERARLEAFNEEFELGPKQMYLFDSFTLPDQRGLRIHGAIFSRIRTDYLARGIEQVLTLTGPENRATMASRSRSGFVRTGGICRIALGPWRWRFSWGSREL